MPVLPHVEIAFMTLKKSSLKRLREFLSIFPSSQLNNLTRFYFLFSISMVKKNLVHSSKRLFQVEKEMTTYLEKCSSSPSPFSPGESYSTSSCLAEELLLHFFDKLISNTALRFISLFFIKEGECLLIQYHIHGKHSWGNDKKIPHISIL